MFSFSHTVEGTNSNSIEVTNTSNNQTWRKTFDNEAEFLAVKNIVQGRNVAYIIPAALVVVRTNSAKNFAKDFFLPTTVNHAAKVNGAVAKFFAVLASLTLDVLTFPVRMITTLPRICYNAKQTENAFLIYLKQQKVDPKLIATDHVQVKTNHYTISKDKYETWKDATGKQHIKYDHGNTWAYSNVNFINVPVYKNHDLATNGTS